MWIENAISFFIFLISLLAFFYKCDLFLNYISLFLHNNEHFIVSNVLFNRVLLVIFTVIDATKDTVVRWTGTEFALDETGITLKFLF